MTTVILYLIVAGVLLGGISWIVDKESSYAKKFEEGLMMMGPLSLSMTGIICLSPVLSKVAAKLIAPLFLTIGIDPAMLGSILPLDMGGYHIAMELAQSDVIGRFAGIVAASSFGCTIVFTIPVAMGMIETSDRRLFSHGILLGFVTIPVGLIVGGKMSGMSLLEIFKQSSFILVLILLIFFFMLKKMDAILKAFEVLARSLKLIAVVGLILAAINFILDETIIPVIMPLGEAMAVVVSICVFLMGSLPLSVLLIRLLRRPMQWLSDRFQMNEHSIIGLLISSISVVPAILMIKDMDKMGKLVNSAFMVSSASVLSAHLAFTSAVEPSFIPALVLSKLSGGIAAVLMARFIAPKILSSKA